MEGKEREGEGRKKNRREGKRKEGREGGKGRKDVKKVIKKGDN